MMKALGFAALTVALASGTATVHAQTTVTRQITTEPVETIITQGPEGTVVTRRPLAQAPDSSFSSTFTAPPVQYAPFGSAPVVAQEEVAAEPAGTLATPRPAAVTRSRTTAKTT